MPDGRWPTGTRLACARTPAGRFFCTDAYLFKPATALNFVRGDDNGTPVQKDEPQAPNRPSGAFIDYWLKAAPSTPVTLQIVDAAGTA